jgi:diketogulonate reductase-like aldo/keto reductase
MSNSRAMSRAKRLVFTAVIAHSTSPRKTAVYRAFGGQLDGGESERILGQSLKNLNIARQDVVIATKVYSRVGPGRNDIGASRGHIMDGVEASLRRLQTDHIDLYQNQFRTNVEFC